MTEKTIFKAHFDTTDPSANLGIEIWLDDVLLNDINPITGPVDFAHNITDDESAHQLKFVLKNKLPGHTKIDDAGNIISDALVTVKDITFDDINVEQLFSELSDYCHDFNGSGNQIEDKFFGAMGCNGTVTFEFSTPFYLWLLENM